MHTTEEFPRHDKKSSSSFFLRKSYYRGEERGLSRKHIIESVQASLKRLQLDYIDIVIVHKADSMCPMEGNLHRDFCKWKMSIMDLLNIAEVVRAMNYVINKGWVNYWGRLCEKKMERNTEWRFSFAGSSKWSTTEIMEAYSNCREFNCVTPIMEQVKRFY